MKHAKRTAKILGRVILTILILSLTLTGCGQGTQEPVDPRDVLPDEWEHGYRWETGIDYYSWSIIVYGACRGNRYYDIDNVEIELSFGRDFYSDIEFERECYLYDRAEVYFVEYIEGETIHEKAYPKICLATKTDDQLSTEKYRVTPIKRNQHGEILEFEFNHSEKIKVPKELFKNQQGEILMFIYADDLLTPEDQSGVKCLGNTRFCYVKTETDEVMLLSPKEYFDYFVDDGID